MAVLAWDKMCIPKRDGGMGFHSLEVFNLALLAKQAWRLLKGGPSLYFKVFRAKYFPTGSVLTSKLGSNPSFVWRSIWSSIPVLQK